MNMSKKTQDIVCSMVAYRCHSKKEKKERKKKKKGKKKKGNKKKGNKNKKVNKNEKVNKKKVLQFICHDICWC